MKLPRVLRSFGTYTAASFLRSAVPFFLIPIITTALSPKDYGIASFYQTIVKLLAGIVMLGVPACCTIFYFRHDKKEYGHLVSNALLAPVLLSILGFVLCILFQSQLQALLDVDMIWVYILCPLALMFLLPEVTYTTLRNKENALQFGILNVLMVLLNLTVTIVLVVVFDFKWSGVLLGVLVSMMAVNLYAFFYLRSGKVLVNPKFDRTTIKYTVLLGAPLVLQRIGGLLINKSDALFISEMLGKETLGLYAIGYQIGMIVLIFQDAFGKAWKPFVFRKMNTEKNKDKLILVGASYLMMIGYLIIPIIIYMLTPYIFDWFIDKKFHPLMMVTPLIGLAYSFLGMYKLVTVYIFYMKRTKLLSSFTILNGLLNIVLNYFMIKWYGAFGAAYATIISMLFIFVIAFAVSAKVCPMPWTNFNAIYKLYRARK